MTRRNGNDASAADSTSVSELPVEWLPLDELVPHPQNYNAHPPDQIVHLQASLMEFGWYRNVVLARGQVILAGHGIVSAARELGWTHAPTLRLDLDPDSAAALKVLALDNEVGRFAERDDRALTELLKQINDESETGLLGTGYDENILAGLIMLIRPPEEIARLDGAAEWVGMPAYDAEENPWQLRVLFDTPEQRVEFLERFGIKDELTYTHAVRKVISARWPKETEPRNTTAMRWEEVAEAGAVEATPDA